MSVAHAPEIVRLPTWRSRAVLAMFILGFCVLFGRSVYLQALKTDFLQEKGEARYSRVLEMPATRGRILDRNGEALAISTPVKSIWAIPEDVRIDESQKRKLAGLLEMDVRDLDARLVDTSRDFVYVKRQIPPEAAAQIEALAVPGIYQQREYRRYYPAGELTAHAVGFTGVDDRGQEGMELAQQERLAGKASSRRVIKDRLGKIVEDMGSIRAAQDGQDLRLSIDSKIQSLVFSALKAAVAEHKAKAGAAIVVDVQTGEVLALANMPTFNPNSRHRLSGAQLRNRVITDTFEPGSTLKPFTIALALEKGVVQPTTRIDTGAGRLTLANHTIHDAHAAGNISVAEVVQKSSNVGTARIALNMKGEDMWSLLNAVGFGSAPQLGFPGAVSGRLRPAKTWRPIEQATIAYGYGVSVSLVQLAHAYTIFARDGDVIPLSLTKVDAPIEGKRVLSAETAREMRAMLELVVQPGGTAPRARVMGWRTAGKTGTAHKQEGGGYASNKYIGSFVGLAPASAPRLVVAVMIDEPSGGQYYGGSVAAPVFANIIAGALRMLGVPYDAPLVPIPIPGENDQVKEST